MTRSPSKTWPSLVLVGRERLIAVLPEIERVEHPVTDLLADIIGLSECRFAAALMPHAVDATVTITPALPDDPAAAGFHDLIKTSITDPARTTTLVAHLPVGQRIEDAGFLSFVIKLLGAGAQQEEIMAMARIVSEAVTTLANNVQVLAAKHLRAVLDRDLPAVSEGWKMLTPTSVWLLATHLAGDPQRPEIIKRRLQAFRLFAALPHVLTEQSITTAIDNGAPLIPVLAKRLDLTEAQVRSLHGAVAPDPASYRIATTFLDAVRELRAHSVPLHEWPGGGRPNQSQAWTSTPWLGTSNRQLLRPDQADPTDRETQDAINGFRDDILRPIAASRAGQSPFRKSHQVGYFLANLEFPPPLLASEERRDYLTAVRQVLIGTRGLKSFREAVAIWHRKAATVAAVRHEAQTDRPGWPPICGPWQSRDGAHAIFPLITAADLVEEGNALAHCVGGYYEPCRRGNTQILSLRRDGAHTATIELLLSGNKDLSVQVGQFKTRRNGRPDALAHDALKEFLGAINGGEHPIDRKSLVAYRRTMRNVWDGAWSSNPSLDHARSVFPLYLPLLPRGTPETFDAWYAASGLDPVIDRAFAAVAGGGSAHRSDAF
ncbi:hypothetical protein L905_06875 [Agrobacterium sp. TS43]|uniref:PcfJ domain-containing protein n=1 Tax=Agrobacterium TaxID=357 RepID=UPI000360DDE9|nr:MULTISPECIES: PcfJ domain-containing protein [Agrobacterium]EPR21219.1 hypothetical protein L902_01720 [Agrobacterium radiobacter DSM 30147]KDR90532.1 hypothetical protein K538_05150 [Agrobacterium tumefaciens GW4]KVK49870.1 hypothetical protein L903_18530 [Agrobacterium sp. JL28]KVK50162.1 hypothetical protein L904_18530 [Agrobacterium sp. LY4]KVK59204.1 hypothetical protein L905_06875 [Agrobacterium sp. TS43]